MDKSSPYLEAMFPQSERPIVDEKAFTLLEIAELKGCNYSSAGRIAKMKVDEGEWEQVWKAGPNKAHKLVKAFRPKVR